MPARGRERTRNRERSRDVYRRQAAARQHDRDLVRHEGGGRGDTECIGAEIKLDRGLGADGQAVADRAHVDAAILRRSAGIKKIQLEETVLGGGLGQRHAHDTARGVAVERDCDGASIVDQHFEIAPRLVRADIVKRQDELARRHVALRHRHENLAPSAEIGEAQPGEETDIGDRYGRQQTNRARRSGRKEAARPRAPRRHWEAVRFATRRAGFAPARCSRMSPPSPSTRRTRYAWNT